MDPKLLFPVLALVFGVLTLRQWWQGRQQGPLPPAAKSWGLIALIFTGVSLWLHLKG